MYVNVNSLKKEKERDKEIMLTNILLFDILCIYCLEQYYCDY